MSTTTTFVVGATGNTGKYVVRELLERGHSVKVVVRSKQRMLDALKQMPSSIDTTNLQITEASFLDLPDSDLEAQIKDCDAAVSCLGHNLTFKGCYGREHRKLVTDAAKRLTTMIEKVNPSCKFILMGTDGVSAPNDDPRTFVERIILFLLRNLLPPHADNEAAAAYMLNDVGKTSKVEWSLVRPTDLIDGEAKKFKIHSKPPGGLFGSGICTRATCAAFMVHLILDGTAWKEYKFQTPVVHDEPEAGDSKKQK